MKKITILLFLLLNNHFFFAQEEVAQLPIEKGGLFNSQKINFSTQIHNKQYLANLFVDNGEMNVRLLNSRFEVISPTLVRRSDYGITNELIGHKQNDSIYSFIFSNEQHTRLVVSSFNFSTNTTERNKIDLNFKGERIVEAFTSFKNRFFVFSASVNGELILRELNSENNSLIEIARFPIDDQKFDNDRVKFKYHFLYSKAVYASLKDDTPASLEKAFHTYKVYGQGNKLILTAESRNIGTAMYLIDINKNTIDYKLVKYPQNETNSLEKFNSFVSNNVLFQIGCSSKSFVMTMKDNEGSILKRYSFNSDESINFKNTPFIQEKDLFFSVKNDIENSKRFLRKVSAENVGISVQNKNDSYELLIGGRKENLVMGLLSVSSAIVLPTSQTISFTSILDKDFNHIEDAIPENTFELLKDFEKDLKRNSTDNIFIVDNCLFYSYIDEKNNLLRFIKF